MAIDNYVMYFLKKSLDFHPIVITFEFLCGPWRTVQGVRCTTLRKIVSCVHLSSPQSRVFFIPGNKVEKKLSNFDFQATVVTSAMKKCYVVSKIVLNYCEKKPF